jgi:3-oxoacyl-[acyl-carrier protein] reductase
VVAINPGATETDRQINRWKARAQAELGDEERWRELTTGFPFSRLARASEVADVVAFMASSRASYVSGAVIAVDGGAGFRR